MAEGGACARVGSRPRQGSESQTYVSKGSEMREMFCFYMRGRLAKPSFGANDAAANVWVCLLLAMMAFLSSAVRYLLAPMDMRTALSLVGAGVVALVAARCFLPPALKAYEVDKVIAQKTPCDATRHPRR